MCIAFFSADIIREEYNAAGNLLGPVAPSASGNHKPATVDASAKLEAENKSQQLANQTPFCLTGQSNNGRG